MRRSSCLALTALTLLGGCGTDGTAPGQTAQAHIVPLVVPLIANSVTFWAYTDRDSEGSLSFMRPNGSPKELLRFRVKPGSLLLKPNGLPFVGVDSIQITIAVAQPGQINFDFQPAGLRFNPAVPAELEIEYEDASGGDLNGDGTVNAADHSVEPQLAIWRQELLNDPFGRIASLRDDATKECEAAIVGFTRYAIAY